MKKTLMLLFLLIPLNIKAIDNIEVDNSNLIPPFNNLNHVYNYFTDKSSIKINVYPDNNLSKTYNLKDGKNKIIIEDYVINVYKNYKKENELYIEDLIIDGYNINFNKDKYEYKINISDEDHLNIKYILSTDDINKVSIIGNGNFNKSDNIIKIIVDSKEYIIHAYKSKNVSLIKNTEEYKVMSNEKKEIVKLIIITISCVLIILFYKLLFRRFIFY